MFETPILTIRLIADLKNNNNGQTKHWSTAHREKKIMTNALMSGSIVFPGDGNMKFSEFMTHIMAEPFSRRVDIIVTRIIGRGQRMLDPDSICRGNCKQCIDACVDAGVLKDDSHQHVGRVLGLQRSDLREIGPAIDLTFLESPDDESIGCPRSTLPCDTPEGI